VSFAIFFLLLSAVPVVAHHISEDSLGGCRYPGEHTPSEVDAHDHSVPVAGEEAALPFQTALGNYVLVGVAGEQADGGRRIVRGDLAVPRGANPRFDPDLKAQLRSSPAMTSVITSMS
jgi:hypothetical protein